jgi:hypothetical protein
VTALTIPEVRRLDERVAELRAEGFLIESRRLGNGLQEYRLIGNGRVRDGIGSLYNDYWCPRCGFEGQDPQVIHTLVGIFCHGCGAELLNAKRPM